MSKQGIPASAVTDPGTARWPQGPRRSTPVLEHVPFVREFAAVAALRCVFLVAEMLGHLDRKPALEHPAVSHPPTGYPGLPDSPGGPGLLRQPCANSRRASATASAGAGNTSPGGAAAGSSTVRQHRRRSLLCPPQPDPQRVQPVGPEQVTPFV